MARTKESQLNSRTFLGFAMRSPHLRAVDLPHEPKLREVRGSANRADAAFTHIWLRGDWIAIVSHQQIWSLPIPLAGEATLLSENWDALPADDGNTVWIQHPSGDRWVRVNGSGSISGPLVVRQPGERLEAVYGQTAAHPDNPRSADDRNIMVLIAVPSLSLTLLDGVFKDFAGTPA